MTSIFYLIVITANILGALQDPFEFEGDYGAQINTTRKKVFEKIVSKKALAKNLNDDEIKKILHMPNASEQEIKKQRKVLIQDATAWDKSYGPTFSELIPLSLVAKLQDKQESLQSESFTSNDIKNFTRFLEKYQDQKAFYFLRNNPKALLKLDKALRELATQNESEFDLPILSSTGKLEGKNSIELKQNLIEKLFSNETFSVTTSQEKVLTSLNQFDEGQLKDSLGNNATLTDLEGFTSSGGQVMFYWLYNCLNLDLIGNDLKLIEEINSVKQVFAKTIGNPSKRAQHFAENVFHANASVVFLQESDPHTAKELIKNNKFHPLNKQNIKDGTIVLLKADFWEPDYEVLSIENYPGFFKGKINLLLATKTDTKERFLLASCHGASTNPSDGRQQISHIMEAYHNYKKKFPDLQIIIGADANTKTEKDIDDLHMHLDSLGLIGTNIGPTTIKKRMSSVQHNKVGRLAIDQEDFIITLQLENNGKYEISKSRIAFMHKTPDNTPIPNLTNMSDHYPVEAILQLSTTINSK